ncbi:MAG: hypothetical protein IPM66_10305 [Acidobacteriota bacterium]|nr:MAG: hypothetical protein IPM66_10305 [Acidobacteriota bacterium]
MAFITKRAEYFYSTVKDEPGEAYQLLTLLAERGINLMAFTAVPIGPMNTQLSIFPDDVGKFVHEAKLAGLEIDGPHPAIMVQGDDELGALASVHRKLFEAKVNVYASMGVSDGKGSFGYLIYVRPDEYQNAVKALGI